MPDIAINESPVANYHRHLSVGDLYTINQNQPGLFDLLQKHTYSVTIQANTQGPVTLYITAFCSPELLRVLSPEIADALKEEGVIDESN